MFTFVEASYESVNRSHLVCNSELCAGYTHVTVGSLKESGNDQKTLLDYLVT